MVLRNLAAIVLLASLGTPGNAQQADPSRPGPHPENLGRVRFLPAPGHRGSANIRVLSHIPLGGYIRVTNLDIEQELSRPYVYVGKRFKPSGFEIISIRDTNRAAPIYSWQIENADLHEGWGTDDVKYFKLQKRYYLVNAVTYQASGVDADLAAIIFDVTSLPDTSAIREVRRIRLPEAPGGFHNVFIYKHSDGRVLLFACVARKAYADIYDMEKLLAGATDYGLAGRVPLPEPRGSQAGYHDIYVGYDPATRQDKFWGNGPETTMEGGNYVFDVTNPANPRLVASVVDFPGQTGTHTFIPTPDSRYAVVRTNGEHQPIRIFDLAPAWKGERTNITRSVGAWTSDWIKRLHNIEIRWPYVFVSGYEESLQIFSMMDPANPYTVGSFLTYDGPYLSRGIGGVNNGAWGIDIRNADGLIVISDGTTGFWAFKMDGFDGWNGHQWGMPNISSAQDWDNGPEGAPQPGKIG